MRKFILERHNYAPELNKIHFDNGVIMRVGNLGSLADIKKFLFAAPTKQGKFIRIKYTNSDNPSLNKNYKGFSTYRGLKVALAALRKKHDMPGGDFNISIRSVYV